MYVTCPLQTGIYTLHFRYTSVFKSVIFQENMFMMDVHQAHRNNSYGKSSYSDRGKAVINHRKTCQFCLPELNSGPQGSLNSKCFVDFLSGDQWG